MTASFSYWKRFWLVSGLVSVLANGAFCQGVGSATPPNLNDSILTSGLSTTGSDGASWAYLIWRSPGSKTLNGRSVAVYQQTTPGGAFTQKAIITPTTAIPAIQLLIQRAATLGADNNACDQDLRDLLRRKNWAGNVVNQIATGTSPFDTKPLAEKISAVISRALQSSDAMVSLQAIAHTHPCLRMALGQAWASPLPAGAGPMVVELREWTGGTDGGVIGRVSLTPGVGVNLHSPGRVVQVPHLKPKSDLTIRLRWAVPDDLRRQQLHLLGFHVYRVNRDFAESNGLTLSATPAQIESFVTIHGGLVMDRVTSNPVPIKRLYSDADVDTFDFPFDPSEPDDHFVSDDQNRNQPRNENDLEDRYGSFSDGSRWRYFVRAVDLLGRTGPPSPVGEAVAVRTIPPDIPQSLTVADLPAGAGGQRHHVLRWKANGIPQGVIGRTTQRYAIYRGNLPENGFTSLSHLESPFLFRAQTPLAIISHSSAVNGWLSYTDTSAIPLPANTNRSVWYAVTALHDSDLDTFFPNLHDRVQSGPSAPAFGVFRDREGPVAPSGFLQINCGKLVSRWLNSGTEVRSATAVPESKRIHIRARCTRRGSDVLAVRFRFYSGRSVGAILLHESPILPLGDAVGDVVTYDTSVFEGLTSAHTVHCVGLGADGCSTIGALSDTSTLPASETVWHVKNFETGLYAATEFEPGEVLAELGETLTFASQTAIGPETVRGALADTSYDGRSVVVQSQVNLPNVGLVWMRRGVAQVRGQNVFFIHPGRSLNDNFSPNYRVILLPEGGDCECLHDARPQDETNVMPIVVSSTVPETTREWRLYRRMDEGELSLVKSLVVDPGPLKPEQVLVQDKNLPPYGAKVRYYLQCFDQNNNPSPFVYIGEVVLVPEPATPLLNTPESLAAVNGMGRVRLKWFCPPPGIENFRIYVAPLDTYDPLATAISSGLKTTTIDLSVPGVIIPTSYQLPGEPAAKSLVSLRFFETEALAIGTTQVQHQAEFEVTPGIDYVIWVSAFGLRQTKIVSSRAYFFRWKIPPSEGPESLVAWPARPLPEVVTLPGVTAFLTNDLVQEPTFLPNASTVHNAATSALYPVGITLGTLALPVFGINHDPADPMCANHPFQFTVKLPAQANQESSVVPTSLGYDPNAYLAKDVLPAVLFRQTILPNEDIGALVQVSPLRASVAHRRDPLPVNLNFGTGEFTTIKDPFIKAFSFSSTPLGFSILSLVDTHPVEEGATYRYFLVNYRADGEISRVVDCGTISIPETP